MKPENIEARKAKRKRDAVRGVVLFALLQLVSAAAFWALSRIPDLPGWAFWLFLILAVLSVLLLIPALAVLRQRFKEIEGGEIDEAGQY